jgi:hypothetical protein
VSAAIAATSGTRPPTGTRGTHSYVRNAAYEAWPTYRLSFRRHARGRKSQSLFNNDSNLYARTQSSALRASSWCSRMNANSRHKRGRSSSAGMTMLHDIAQARTLRHITISSEQQQLATGETRNRKIVHDDHQLLWGGPFDGTRSGSGGSDRGRYYAAVTHTLLMCARMC